jgi:hypothetical protein
LIKWDPLLFLNLKILEVRNKELDAKRAINQAARLAAEV